MIKFMVDKDVAKAALLYVAGSIPNIDKHKLYKILYFAEQAHVVNYGKPITGDTYIKMEYGPAPSYIKDKVEQNLDSDGSVETKHIYVSVNEYPNLDYLSESAIETLDLAIETYKDKSFAYLTRQSHKLAWDSASFGRSMDPVLIAMEADAPIGVIDYLKENLRENIELT